jgi:hypothetical protein
MTDVVGLRFVAEGDRELLSAIQRVDRAERDLSATAKALESVLSRKLATEDAVIQAYVMLAKAGMTYSDVLKGAAQDEKMAAQTAQQHANTLLGVEQAYKSASDSARVFVQVAADQQRVLQISQQWASELNDRLGVTGQRATELGATFGRLAEVQRNLDASAQVWTTGLNDRLGVTGQRATELGATFGRLAEVQRNLDAAAQVWTTGLNDRLGVTGQRATELGATFGRLAEVQRNLDASAQVWTTGLNDRLGVTGQRATELGATFGRLAEVQRNLDASAQVWTTGLNDRLGVTGQRATELGATFGRLAEVQRNLDAAAQVWTTGLNDRLGVTGQRATELGATFGRLAEVQRNLDAAAQVWTTGLNDRLGVTGQRATELGATFGRLEEVQRNLAATAQKWTADLNERLGVTGQRATEAGAGFAALEADQKRVATQFAQLEASIDPATAANQRFQEAERLVNAAISDGLTSKERGRQVLDAYGQRLKQTTTAAGALRAQMLATANSIAILDGPLGGVASRFSAFGVLIGRTGLLIGGLLVSFAALGAVLNRGIRNLTEWEAANARVNAILETTGHQVGLTGEAIRNMTSQIALNTLESEQSVMAAAQRLLTFRDIAGNVFEDVLKAATDMAALGFGTVESETVKLAKALEDPAQALTSLSRAGIVFTRQQRALIISLVESGRQAEAMERILSNVNARVGGAAEAAARDTLAGAFDTIGQAAGRAVRGIAGTILQVTGLDAAIRRLAASVADFAAGPATTEQRAQEQLTTVREFEREIAEMQRRLDERSVHAGMRASFRSRMQERQALLDVAREELQVLEDAVRAEQRAAAAARARQMVGRDVEALDNLTTEIDLRRQIIGLTDDEQRLQRNLAQLGLRNLDIDQRISAYREQLVQAGIAQRIINQFTDEYRTKLAGVAVQVERAMDTARMERMASAVQGSLTSLDQQNRLLGQQLHFMQQGMEASEARQRAEETLLMTEAERLADADRTNDKLREMSDLLALAIMHSRDLKARMDEVAQAAEIRQRLESSLQGLLDQRDVLDAQLVLLEQGVDFTIAQRLAEIEVQKARVQTQIVTSGITDELQAQLDLLNAMSGVVIEVGEREARVSTFRPSRGGGGRAQQTETLESVIAALDQRIEREETLLRLTGQARIEQELYYEITDRLRQLEIPFREENIRAMLRERAERLQTIEDIRQQQQLQEQVASTMANLFMAATRGADAFRQALAGVLTQLAQMLANRAFMQILEGSGFGGAGGLFGPGSFLGMLFRTGRPAAAAANGMAFTGGNVIPFANGGVVSSPTMFPMSRGRTGLMGEAGPEAVMPLRRAKDGKLGVGAEPQKVDVVARVYVDEGGNWQAKVERIADMRVSRAAPALVRQSVGATYAASTERRFK